MTEQPNNPLHGIKLADILEYLVKTQGWKDLGAQINIRCFNSEPSIKSSLTFLRKTLWAREKVERLYLQSIKTTPHVRSETDAQRPHENRPPAIED